MGVVVVVLVFRGMLGLVVATGSTRVLDIIRLGNLIYRRQQSFLHGIQSIDALGLLFGFLKLQGRQYQLFLAQILIPFGLPLALTP